MNSSSHSSRKKSSKESGSSESASEASLPTRQQQPIIFSTYSAVASVYCAAFSWIFFTIGDNLILGWIHLGAFVVVVANWIIFRTEGRSSRPIHIILATGTAVVASLLATGGWEGTGYLWTFGYLPYATFLPEKKHGMFWIFLLLAIDAILAVLSHIGLMIVPYSNVQLFNFFACYVVFAVCIYLFKDALEKSERIILKNAEELRMGKEMDRLKSEFVALVSHQLRSPLTLMAWSLERLDKSGVAQASQRAQEEIATARRETRHMAALINDILDASRLEAGTLVIEPYDVDLVALAKKVVANISSIAHAKGLVIETSYPASFIIRLDPTLMQIVVTNLLSNAMKYTPSGGMVKVGIVPGVENVVISVADTGYGIAPDEQAKVFSKLFRGKRAMQADSIGTGLGLYIVKSIVTEAGGSVRFDSEEGKGTCFYVTLPVNGMRPKTGNIHLSAVESSINDTMQE